MTGLGQYVYRARVPPFNRIQSRVVSGLLTIHNTLRRHVYIMGLIDRLSCSRMKPQLKLCVSEALAILRRTNFGPFFLDAEDVRNLRLGAIWNFIRGTGLPWLGQQCKGHKGSVKKVLLHRDRKGSNPFTTLSYPTVFYSTPNISSLMFIGDYLHVWHLRMYPGRNFPSTATHISHGSRAFCQHTEVSSLKRAELWSLQLWVGNGAVSNIMTYNLFT